MPHPLPIESRIVRRSALSYASLRMANELPLTPVSSSKRYSPGVFTEEKSAKRTVSPEASSRRCALNVERKATELPFKDRTKKELARALTVATLGLSGRNPI
jgi:hypothetical protein